MSKLIIVGTSLGNLDDISPRAIKAVFESPIILAEDTRVFHKMKQLLKDRSMELLEAMEVKFETEQMIMSYREQIHEKILPFVLQKLNDGVDVSLFSDAGMPAISDPGWNLIEDVLKSNFEIDVIPGPTAIESALILSGLPTDRFTFLGFLPRRKGRAVELVSHYLNDENTIVIYESPFRVVKTLLLINERLGKENRIQAAAVGEITKKFQKAIRGEVGEVIEKLKKMGGLKGEWVICLRNYSN
jgi:16S rRNA (cytidine1402-2'-O)-methyltransferase